MAAAAERLPTVVPSWVAEGIALDELVVVVTTGVGTLIDDLTSAAVRAAALRDDGRLVVRTPEEAFLTDGVLDVQVFLDRLTDREALDALSGDLRASTEVLRLATRVAPDAVTIDHPPRSVRRILETANWDPQPNLTVTTR